MINHGEVAAAIPQSRPFDPVSMVIKSFEAALALSMFHNRLQAEIAFLNGGVVALILNFKGAWPPWLLLGERQDITSLATAR
jgi:hypothetical protein